MGFDMAITSIRLDELHAKWCRLLIRPSVIHLAGERGDPDRPGFPAAAGDLIGNMEQPPALKHSFHCP